MDSQITKYGLACAVENGFASVTEAMRMESTRVPDEGFLKCVKAAAAADMEQGMYKKDAHTMSQDMHEHELDCSSKANCELDLFKSGMSVEDAKAMCMEKCQFEQDSSKPECAITQAYTKCRGLDADKCQEKLDCKLTAAQRNVVDRASR